MGRAGAESSGTVKPWAVLPTKAHMDARPGPSVALRLQAAMALSPSVPAARRRRAPGPVYGWIEPLANLVGRRRRVPLAVSKRAVGAAPRSSDTPACADEHISNSSLHGYGRSVTFSKMQREILILRSLQRETFYFNFEFLLRACFLCLWSLQHWVATLMCISMSICFRFVWHIIVQIKNDGAKCCRISCCVLVPGAKLSTPAASKDSRIFHWYSPPNWTSSFDLALINFDERQELKHHGLRFCLP